MQYLFIFVNAKTKEVDYTIYKSTEELLTAIVDYEKHFPDDKWYIVKL